MNVYPRIPIARLIAFVEEDAPFGDITSLAVLPKIECRADILSREDLVLAGSDEASRLFSYYGVRAESSCRDGEKIPSGSIIMTLWGDAHAILLVERTALNLLGRMSGIATMTNYLQEKVASVNKGCRIAATRKTAPGLRVLDKKAAAIGGADPHRYSLSDAILIKDTHRALIPLGEAVRRARESGVYHCVEAEAESVEEAVEAALAGADIILLDNMKPDVVKKALRALSDAGCQEKVIIELSGGITPETIEDYAIPGVHRISLGMLTHTVRNADFSLEISPEPRHQQDQRP
ncbi:MAG TPA: carboxylating nicotinate-nucleotide diphosphorylase [Methanospirillum sp.]|nr:carboxylating nicotinate-nucleotide diphosphorylase [Methanospirillum sp.]